MRHEGTNITNPPARLPQVAEYVRDVIITNDEVPKLFREAAQHSMSRIEDRMAAAVDWRTMHSLGFDSASELEATRTILNLLDLAVAESASLEGLSRRLSDGWQFKLAQGVASDGAALAIGSGDLHIAVSLLEQGRSIIYNQLGRYRWAIDDVHRVSPELASRLVGLGALLDALVVRGERMDPNCNTKNKPSDDDTTR